MKKLACKDLGGVTCSYVAEGETNEEVKGRMMNHAHAIHSDKLEGMSDEDKKEMDAKMDASITEE